MIQAGHPSRGALGYSGTAPDSLSLRADPNTTISPLAGVGSLFVDPGPSSPGGDVCAATAIGPTTVLTAVHCLDVLGPEDGLPDVSPGLEYSELDDEGGLEPELVAWDFEFQGDLGRYHSFGNPFVFPNTEETTLGSADSGGPGFMRHPGDPGDPTLSLATVNTYT